MAPSDKPISTADVPAEFLKAAFLVGNVPQRILRWDDRISYSMYIPPPPVYTSTPSPSQPRLPLLVFMHGTLRNLAPMRNDLAAFAEDTHCAVVAPLFPVGLEGPDDISSYKELRSHSGPLRSDAALLAILDEIAALYPGISTEKFFLMGFSGGGQFAHRFMYLYPERLAGVCPGAPGTVTVLDHALNWPKGVKDTEQLFGRKVNVDALRRVPVKLFVGSEDVHLHGGQEFWRWVQKTRGKDRKSGEETEAKGATRLSSRLEGAQLLQRSLQSHGVECGLEIVQGAGHDGDSVRPSMLSFLRGLITAQGAK